MQQKDKDADAEQGRVIRLSLPAGRLVIQHEESGVCLALEVDPAGKLTWGIVRPQVGLGVDWGVGPDLVSDVRVEFGPPEEGAPVVVEEIIPLTPPYFTRVSAEEALSRTPEVPARVLAAAQQEIHAQLQEDLAYARARLLEVTAREKPASAEPIRVRDRVWLRHGWRELNWEAVATDLAIPLPFLVGPTTPPPPEAPEAPGEPEHLPVCEELPHIPLATLTNYAEAKDVGNEYLLALLWDIMPGEQQMASLDVLGAPYEERYNPATREMEARFEGASSGAEDAAGDGGG